MSKIAMEITIQYMLYPRPSRLALILGTSEDRHSRIFIATLDMFPVMKLLSKHLRMGISDVSDLCVIISLSQYLLKVAQTTGVGRRHVRKVGTALLQPSLALGTASNYSCPCYI